VEESIAAVDFESEDRTELLKQLTNRAYRGFFDRNTGVVYLTLGGFVEHLNWCSGRRWTLRDAADFLGRHSFTYKQKGVRYTDESGVSRVHNLGRFWTSPPGYVNDTTGETPDAE
jgi:hypothetical protein